MKLKLFVIIFLFCGGAVYAQNQVNTNIDQTHRGYDINVNATGTRSFPPPRPVVSVNVGETQRGTALESQDTPKAQWHGKYLVSLGLGYFYTNDFDYGYKFSMPASALLLISFTAYPTQYLGLGAGISYNSNTSREKNIGVDEATLSYTTVSPNIYLAGRYPMLIYDWLEPYANLGLAYHMNEFEYKYDVSGGPSANRKADGNSLGVIGEFGVRAYAFETVQAGFGLRYVYNKQDITGTGSVNMSGIALMLTLGVLL
jgi:hypothetical protein